MKLLSMGDAHITDDRPVNRTDNYWETVKRKLRFIFKLAENRGCKFILSPGDLTDTPNLSYAEFTELVQLVRHELSVHMFCVRGQHDMRYRRKENTALTALASSLYKQLTILEYGIERSVEDDKTCTFQKMYAFQGASYGEEIPKPVEGAFNILLIHKMIVEEKLWSAQEEYEPSNVFLRQHNFDLIVSGDNHQGFITSSKGGRLLVNCGAMMRNSISLVNHQPFVVIYDTEIREYEKVFIPIEPSEKVFRMEKVAAELS